MPETHVPGIVGGRQEAERRWGVRQGVSLADAAQLCKCAVSCTLPIEALSRAAAAAQLVNLGQHQGRAAKIGRAPSEVGHF